MGPIEFLKFASSMIKPFSGEQAQLESFIVNVNLVKSVCTSELMPIFVSFVNGRLEGKARDYIPEASSIEEIVENLRKHIKPEASAVLEAKLGAVNLDTKNLSSFAEEIERLSDKLIHALVLEGVTAKKAIEMSVIKVVDTCRNQTRDDLVKCVLASAHFETPKAVLAKFTTEVAARIKDKQIMVYGNSRGQYRGQYHGQNRGQYRGQSRGYYENSQRDNSQQQQPNRGNQPSGNYVRVIQGNEEAARWLQPEEEVAQAQVAQATE